MTYRRRVCSVFMSAFLCAFYACLQSSSAQDKVLKLDEKVIASEQQRIEAIEKASRAAVSVFDAAGSGGGSGVVISADGYALTNYHVVQPCGNFMRCSMPDGKLYDAVLVGLDPTGDVALIKLLGRDDFPVAVLGDSDQVQVGQWCFAVGNPFLLATNRQPTISYGIVSGVHRYQYPAGSLLEYADCIQTDAAINPGNSGGPLFDREGKLIGINGRGSFEKRGRVNVGVGYAISINQIKHFESCLRAGRIVDHATLGATMTNSEGHVVVSNILPSSDAYRRGLRYNDEIVSFAGREIRSVNEIKNALGIFPKGWRVPLVYRRDNGQFEISVRLTGVHASSELIDIIQGTSKEGEDIEGEDIEEEDKDEKKKQDTEEESDEENEEPEEQPLPIEIPFDEGDVSGLENMEIPKAAQELIEEKRGYANFWFNRLNRDRLWEKWAKQLDRDSLRDNWKITGNLETGEPFEMLIGDVVSGGRFPSGAELVDLQRAGTDGNTADMLGPEKSGGLLLSLNIWRTLVKASPEQFGDVYYFGKLPLPTKKLAYDVLVATRELTESHFYFDSDSKLPVALEMFPDVEADPCELFFDDYRAVGESMMPFDIRVVHAGRTYGRLKIDGYEFVPPKEQPE